MAVSRSSFAEWRPLLIGLGVVFGVVLVISAISPTTPAPPPTPTAAQAATPAPAPPTTSDTPAQPATLCDPSYNIAPADGPYDGGTACRPGEIVTIAHITDAATFQLTDGRHIRLAGLVVRPPTTCGGAAALTDTRGQFTEGQQVNMLHEPGAGTDKFGNQWVYLQGNQGFWNSDLGQFLVMYGDADILPNSGANPAYMKQLSYWGAGAKDGQAGQWGPRCGPPTPDSGPDSGSSVHVDVDHHHHNMPDGSLTGGFCRHHWWC
jgi:hypothetical protein